MAEEEMISGEWHRCGNTTFWRDPLFGLDGSSQTFIDPVDLLFINASGYRNGIQIGKDRIPSITRSVLLESLEIMKSEDPERAMPRWAVLNLWLGKVLDASSKNDQFKPTLLKRLADMPSEDINDIFEGLKALFEAAENEDLIEYGEEVTVPMDPTTMWDALGKFGILEC